MTSDQLIAEGRKLQRPCVFLRPQRKGAIAAVWHEPDVDEIQTTGFRCWLTLDCCHVPGVRASKTRYISIFTDDEKCQGGRVEVLSSWPNRGGTKLYAHHAEVLPPIEAVFARGTEAVGRWLQSYGWQREWGYNDNFKGKQVVEQYERTWKREFPLYSDSDVYAVLGGWHWPSPDDNWHDLIDDTLLVFTIRDSEPWVETGRTRKASFKVVQRIT